MMQLDPKQIPTGRTTIDDSGAGNRPESVWGRLRDNLERNRETFQKTGVPEDKLPTAECRRCGTMESVTFWSVQSRRRDTLTLLCPYCERGTARYGLATNRVDAGGERAGAIKLGSWTAVVLVLLVSSVVYFQGQEVVRVLERSWNRMAASAPAGVPAPRVQWEGRGWEVPSFTDRFEGVWRRNPAVGAVAAPAGSHVFVAFGDRVAEVEAALREAGAADSVLELRYLEAQGVTQLIITGSATELAERFDALSEWERLQHEATG